VLSGLAQLAADTGYAHMERDLSTWYFETSGFNHLVKSTDFESLLNTRELQKLKGRVLYVSPITLWELMLTSDDFGSDLLVFSAQNLFSEKLLATPTELIIRYIKNAYPENKVNYDIHTELEIGNVWSKMTKDNSIKFEYNKSQLKEKTSLIRKISKNLPTIIDGTIERNRDEFLFNISKVLSVYYECLRDDGFLSPTSKYDEEVLFKLVVLFAMLFFVLRMDFDSKVIVKFWTDKGVQGDDPTKILMYLFETYPELLKKGPLLEMAVMAYNQVKLGSANRGLLLDCYHMIYAPYVNWIVTGDMGFDNLKKLESHYSEKIVHVSEMNIRTSPYLIMNNSITKQSTRAK
jgi:hypothetical protein